MASVQITTLVRWTGFATTGSKKDDLEFAAGAAHGHGPPCVTSGERTLLSAWLKQGREALRTGMGPEPGPGVTFLPSRPQSPTHHDVFLTCASK
jgi:hypothetical protein